MSDPVSDYPQLPCCPIPLAGHSDKFRGSAVLGTVAKLTGLGEEKNYHLIEEDEYLRHHLPALHGSYPSSTPGKVFLLLENCLHSFSDSANILDCKMGVRTFTEETLMTARQNPELRYDLYQRMVEVDHTEPTQVEHYLQKVALHRFMVWRDTISSTTTLGFRIKGVRKRGISYQHYKTVTSKKKIFKVILSFLKDFPWTATEFLGQLETLRNDLKCSKFFESHEFIGTSLLFVVDKSRCGVWLIDLEKVSPLPHHVTVDHVSDWAQGNHEDGYVSGLDNLICLFKNIVLHFNGEEHP